MTLIEAYIITFIASFCSLVIEMVAGRILAPFVGVSLYTWTSIIGVILAGISIGAYIGGRLVDRFPHRRTLGILLFFSGVAALAIIPLTNLVAAYRFPFSLMWRIFTVTSIIFFIPGCILGTISPVVVRLTLQSLHRAGNVIGKIYAFSTLGAILGTFATGFVLISWLGTRNIIFIMGIILILTSLLSGDLFRKKSSVAILLVVCTICLVPLYNWAFKIPLTDRIYYQKESDYYNIKLTKTTSADRKTPLHALVLDNLIHSYVSLDNPLHIEYEYERIYAEVLKWLYQPESPFKTLSIGGGGYTFPRYMELSFPKADIEVVEIDPQVTEIVYRFFGLPRNTRIRTTNTDGRWFVMNCKEKYDVIFTDAFNDLSIPYHLTTKEFVQQLHSILTAHGILMSNIIDNFQKGAFLPSYMRTLQQVFGEKHVYLISISPDFKNLRISTFIVVASKGNLDMNHFDAWLKNKMHGQAKSVLVSDRLVDELLTKRKSITLTDEYAPVDNLIAPIFEERFGYNRKS
ncbi:MAG: spermidine synthase [Syntrophorhabdaceae bacterium PtaU1.Bin034]|nr:MAG: spermidine synthase [Syntrophorhabdaceae bacterium PtaU1.Bin034]